MEAGSRSAPGGGGAARQKERTAEREAKEERKEEKTGKNGPTDGIEEQQASYTGREGAFPKLEWLNSKSHSAGSSGQSRRRRARNRSQKCR